MNNAQRRFELAQRLAFVSTLHAVFQDVTLKGEYDQEWAEWYAKELIDRGWNDLFQEQWTVESLAKALAHANHDHRQNDPKRRWQDYYAAELVKVK